MNCSQIDGLDGISNLSFPNVMASKEPGPDHSLWGFVEEEKLVVTNDDLRAGGRKARVMQQILNGYGVTVGYVVTSGDHITMFYINENGSL